MKRLISTLVALMTFIVMAWPSPIAKGPSPGASALKLRSGLNLSTTSTGTKPISESSPGISHKAIKKMKALDSNGEEWDVSINLTGWKCSELFSASFEDVPYYLIECAATKSNGNGGVLHKIELPLFWPANASLTDLLPIDDLTKLSEQGLNVFSTRGNFVEDPSHYQIWPEPQQLYFSIFNGEYNTNNYLSQSNPTTVTFTTDGSGGYNIDLDIFFNSESLIGSSELKLSSHYANAAELPKLSMTEYPCLYLIGQPQEWDIDNGNIAIQRVSNAARVYRGNLYIPSGQFEFRFYGQLRDWESYSIGAMDDDEPVEIQFNNEGMYEGPLYEGGADSQKGKGKWSAPDWAGGRFKAEINLEDKKLAFTKIAEPEAFYPVFYQQDVSLNIADYPIRKVSDKIYEGIIDVPAELHDNNQPLMLIFSDKSNNLYDQEDYFISRNNGDDIYIDRIEKSGRIFNGTGGYVFRVVNYPGTRLKVRIDLASGHVFLSNPDVAPITPEEVALSFAADTPENIVFGVPTDITVTYPEGVLDNYYISLDCDRYDAFSIADIVRNPGSITYKIIPNVIGELKLQASSYLGNELGIAPVERSFNCVAPDYIHAAETITLKGHKENGTYEVEMKKTADGVFSGMIDLDGQTVFRIHVPTDNGQIVLGPIADYFEGWSFGSDTYYNNKGNEDEMCQQFFLLDVTSEIETEDGKNSFFLGTANEATSEIIIDLNTMSVVLFKPGMKPYFSIDQTDYKARRNEQFRVVAKSNITDYHYDQSRPYITIENPELVWLDWVYRENDNVVYQFNTNESTGSTLIHISSPMLKKFGIEATVKVTVDEFKTEAIILSTPLATIRQGEFAKVSYESEPIAGQWTWMQSEGNSAKAFNDENSSFYVLGNSVGETNIEVVAGDNENVRGQLKVIVIPADASRAEHIVFTQLEPHAFLSLSLDDHKDGTAANPQWSSSDESVATVDAQGNVTAIKAGRAVITADCGEHQIMAGIHVPNSVEAAEIAAPEVSVFSHGTSVTVIGTNAGDMVNIHAADGALMSSRKSDGSTLRFELGIHGAFIVTAGRQSFKVVL